MSLIELESVKDKVLRVKVRVDIALRQGAELSQERYNTLLLGNPGTGKTTVARHYAKCLASVGVVAGDMVPKITASGLMDGGVPAYRKLVDELMSDGGGAILINEAYQFTSGVNTAGRQVLMPSWMMLRI
ncbi:hypothetical protein LTS10_013144 [Elasticomyces elasticus]|nr:hypothetical protein LTS10_013144 [Elasticomyces elasticus]